MEWSEWKANEALGKDEEEEEVRVENGKIVKHKIKKGGVKINNTEALKAKYEAIRLHPEVLFV